MATVIATFDTVTKSFSVSVDGQESVNVDELCVHRRYSEDGKPEKYHMSLYQSAEDKQNKSHVRLVTTASENGELEQKEDIQTAIASFFDR